MGVIMTSLTDINNNISALNSLTKIIDLIPSEQMFWTETLKFFEHDNKSQHFAVLRLWKKIVKNHSNKVYSDADELLLSDIKWVPFVNVLFDVLMENTALVCGLYPCDNDTLFERTAIKDCLSRKFMEPERKTCSRFYAFPLRKVNQVGTQLAIVKYAKKYMCSDYKWFEILVNDVAVESAWKAMYDETRTEDCIECLHAPMVDTSKICTKSDTIIAAMIYNKLYNRSEYVSVDDVKFLAPYLSRIDYYDAMKHLLRTEQLQKFAYFVHVDTVRSRFHAMFKQENNFYDLDEAIFKHFGPSDRGRKCIILSKAKQIRLYSEIKDRDDLITKLAENEDNLYINWMLWRIFDINLNPLAFFYDSVTIKPYIPYSMISVHHVKAFFSSEHPKSPSFDFNSFYTMLKFSRDANISTNFNIDFFVEEMIPYIPSNFFWNNLKVSPIFNTFVNKHEEKFVHFLIADAMESAQHLMQICRLFPAHMIAKVLDGISAEFLINSGYPDFYTYLEICEKWSPVLKAQIINSEEYKNLDLHLAKTTLSKCICRQNFDVMHQFVAECDKRFELITAVVNSFSFEEKQEFVSKMRNTGKFGVNKFLFSIKPLRNLFFFEQAELDRLSQLTSDDVLLDDMELPCSICLNECDEAVSLSCSHYFCGFCIDSWKNSDSQMKETCPVCRKNIVY